MVNMTWLNPFHKKKPVMSDVSRSRQPSPWAAPTIHTKLRSRSYNDWWLQRREVLKLVKEYDDVELESAAIQVSDTRLIKFGTRVQLTEAVTLRYIRKHTKIPVPKVYCAFRDKNTTYIMMEFVDGEPIGDNWAQRTEAEKQDLMMQLKAVFTQLRNMPHPRPGFIAAVDMQALYDPRCWQGWLGFSPFANEADFNNYLRCGVDMEHKILDANEQPGVTAEERTEMVALIESHQSKNHRICFTHEVASSSNVLVKDGRIVVVIYFEVSGWFPEYWEYTTAMNVHPGDIFWKDEIPRFLDVYFEELEMGDNTQEALRTPRVPRKTSMGLRSS